jgi:hypothetical protein
MDYSVYNQLSRNSSTDWGAHLLQSCKRWLSFCVQGCASFFLESSCVQGYASFFLESSGYQRSGLQAFFIDFYHYISFRFILYDDFIFSTCKVHICFYSGKGAGLWLVIRLSICLFHIAHFIFILVLCFCLSLIQFLTFSFFTCECEHELNIFATHLVRCPFGGQWIATHSTI